MLSSWCSWNSQQSTCTRIFKHRLCWSKFLWWTIFRDNIRGHLSEKISNKQFSIWFWCIFVNIKTCTEFKSLTVSVCKSPKVFDANQWQNLITSSLPFEKTFNFRLLHYHRITDFQPYNAGENFKQFQTNFWQVQHQWHTRAASQARCLPGAWQATRQAARPGWLLKF